MPVYDLPKTDYKPTQTLERMLRPSKIVEQRLSGEEWEKLQHDSLSGRILAQAATINTDPVNREKAYQHWKKADDAYKRGDLQTSKSELDRAIALDPINSGYYNDLGVRFATEQNFPKAVELYRRAIELNNGLNPITFYNMAKSLKFWAKKEMANKNYQQALALFQESRENYLRFLQVGSTPNEVIASQNSIRSIDAELGKLPKT